MEKRQIAGLAGLFTAAFGISLGVVYWINAERVIDLADPLVWLYEICFGGPMTDEEMANMSGNERPMRWLMAIGLIGLSIYSMATRKPMVLPSALAETTVELTPKAPAAKSRAAAIVEDAVKGRIAPPAPEPDLEPEAIVAKVAAKVAQPAPASKPKAARVAAPKAAAAPKAPVVPEPERAAPKAAPAPTAKAPKPVPVSIRPQDVLVLLCKVAQATGGVSAGQLLAPIRNVCGSAPSTVTVDVALEKVETIPPKRVIAPFRTKIDDKRAARVVQSALNVAWRNGEFSREALGIIGGLTDALGLSEEEVVAHFKKVAGSRQIRLADPTAPKASEKKAPKLSSVKAETEVTMPKPMVAQSRVVTRTPEPRDIERQRRLRDRAERRRPTRERRPTTANPAFA